MNIKQIHITKALLIEDAYYYEVEITEGIETLVTYTKTWGEQQLQDFCNDTDIEVTFESEDEDLFDSIKYFKVGYIEVDTFADGSNEHDVILHKSKFEDGRLVHDFHGTNLKTYKQEKSAIKYANTLGYMVMIH